MNEETGCKWMHAVVRSMFNTDVCAEKICNITSSLSVEGFGKGFMYIIWTLPITYWPVGIKLEILSNQDTRVLPSLCDEFIPDFLHNQLTCRSRARAAAPKYQPEGN